MSQIYEFFILNKSGQCLFYEDFVANTTIEKFKEDKQERGRLKNINGIAEGLKIFAKNLGMISGNKLRSFITQKYKYNFFESASGLKFIILSSETAKDLSETLSYLYTDVYIEYVNRNPLYVKDTIIEIPAFRDKVKEVFK